MKRGTVADRLLRTLGNRCLGISCAALEKRVRSLRNENIGEQMDAPNLLSSSVTERTPRNIWEAYRTQFDVTHSNLNRHYRALKFANDRLTLKIVKYATFDDLAAAGIDVRRIDNGAVEFRPSKGKLPENWAIPQELISPEVATLHDALLLKNGAALLPDGYYCFHDASYAFENWRKKIVRGMVKFTDPKSDQILVRRPGLRKRIYGRCFSTRSDNYGNMGHFIHDILSRIYYEDIGTISPGREKIIPPLKMFPMQKFLFERIYADYEIVETPPRTALKVEELLLPRNLCSDYGVNPAAISSLAKRMRGIAAPYAGSRKRKICISRRDSQHGGVPGRKFVNMEAFEELMRKMGYDIVEVSKLGPEEQLELWANATDVVGIHGAGMMNCLFMQPGASYTEIAGAPVVSDPDHFVAHSTARCAIIAGHKVSGLVGELDHDGNPVINMELLKEILS